ncbi:ABC transporter ATP-binding protein [Clostridium tarantellae]|uniref:ATP-binding cassette domain-containing protein n=1 Tax=Clostridium tarantellae TaxID=39493 RepID=A0A6I1MNI1_9CLOT|nr:ABC transporter ATP-binding protein [Clostridium tarantellae]MPQ45056.1 ATP-binding cassette domain-containing protein [Clostridium tarantellae]
MELKFDRLTKEFNNKIAVNPISITLKTGVYGLLGANGAGKTTLMRMICGVLTPTSGHILLDGYDINSLGENYRKLLGYLPQDFGYYPDFTAKEFMYYVAALKGINKISAKSKTKELLELVGLWNVANKKIKTFSGGMKQRLGIAQAVLNDPKILVLDEPTAGLDPKERIRFRNLISNFSKDKIVILSTHIVSDIEYIADTILMMKGGKIILNSPRDGITKEIEKKVWQCVILKNEVDTISSKYRVVNLQHHNNNQVYLRIVSDTKPNENAINVDPTLEDLFLYHFDDILPQ